MEISFGKMNSGKVFNLLNNLQCNALAFRPTLQQTPEASTESNGSSTTSATSATTKETDGSGPPAESAQRAVFGVHTSSGRVPDQVITLH